MAFPKLLFHIWHIDFVHFDASPSTVTICKASIARRVHFELNHTINPKGCKQSKQIFRTKIQTQTILTPKKSQFNATINCWTQRCECVSARSRVFMSSDTSAVVKIQRVDTKLYSTRTHTLSLFTFKWLWFCSSGCSTEKEMAIWSCFATFSVFKNYLKKNKSTKQFPLNIFSLILTWTKNKKKIWTKDYFLARVLSPALVNHSKNWHILRLQDFHWMKRIHNHPDWHRWIFHARFFFFVFSLDGAWTAVCCD